MHATLVGQEEDFEPCKHSDNKVQQHQYKHHHTCLGYASRIPLRWARQGSWNLPKALKSDCNELLHVSTVFNPSGLPRWRVCWFRRLHGLCILTNTFQKESANKKLQHIYPSLSLKRSDGFLHSGLSTAAFQKKNLLGSSLSKELITKNAKDL